MLLSGVQRLAVFSYSSKVLWGANVLANMCFCTQFSKTGDGVLSFYLAFQPSITVNTWMEKISSTGTEQVHVHHCHKLQMLKQQDYTEWICQQINIDCDLKFLIWCFPKSLPRTDAFHERLVVLIFQSHMHIHNYFLIFKCMCVM